MSVTRELAQLVVSHRPEDVPADVRHEARRALLNFVGCAIGGSTEDAVEIAIRTLAPYSGPQIACVLGRAERLDPLRASFLNGIAAHVHDFDDTTPKNYIHPSAPVLSALLAYASTTPVSGAELMHAFILGFEAESRIGNAVKQLLALTKAVQGPGSDITQIVCTVEKWAGVEVKAKS